MLKERAARQAEETELARKRLLTHRPTKLSEVGTLDPVEFALFLGLLGDALAARGPRQQKVSTTTSDGTLEIRLTALDEGTAEIRTPEGTFRGPEHVIEIIDLTAAEDEEWSA